MVYQLVARTPAEVKKTIQTESKYEGVKVESALRGAITGHLNRYLAGDDNRRLVIAWIFDLNKPGSMKELTSSQLYSLYSWIGAEKNEEGKWEVQPCFAAEAAMVLSESIRWYSMMPKDKMILFGDCRPPDMVEAAVSFCNGEVTAVTDFVGEWIQDEHITFPFEFNVSDTKRVEEEKIEPVKLENKPIKKRNPF